MRKIYLTPAEEGVLAYLVTRSIVGYKGAMKRQIARHLNLTWPTTGTVLRALRKRGLVQRDYVEGEGFWANASIPVYSPVVGDAEFKTLRANHRKKVLVVPLHDRLRAKFGEKRAEELMGKVA